MKLNTIEGLKDEQITELYDDVIENGFNLTYAGYWLCDVTCSCSDGSIRYAYGYFPGGPTGTQHYLYQCDPNWAGTYYISGGCAPGDGGGWNYWTCRSHK